MIDLSAIIVYDEDTFERVRLISNILMKPIFKNWYYEGEVVESESGSSMHFFVTNNMALLERYHDGDSLENAEKTKSLLASIPEDDYSPIIGSDGLDPNSEEGIKQACLIDIDTGNWEYRAIYGKIPDELEEFLANELLSLK